MAFSITDGFIQPARWVPSPNYSARPNGSEISLLVVHNISLPPGEFGGRHVEDFFQNCLNPDLHPYFASIVHLRVSAHCLINRAGELVQFVNLSERAWHAGVSCFGGRDNCNDFSIGVELEGSDDQPFSDAQYEALASLSCALVAVYPLLTPQRIVGHSDIAPGRKTDPGPCFNWQRFYTALSAISPSSENAP